MKRNIALFVLTTITGLAAAWLLTSNHASKVQSTEASEWPIYTLESASFGYSNPRLDASELVSEITEEGQYPLLTEYKDSIGNIWVMIADKDSFVWLPDVLVVIEETLESGIAPFSLTPAEVEVENEVETPIVEEEDLVSLPLFAGIAILPLFLVGLLHLQARNSDLGETLDRLATTLFEGKGQQPEEEKQAQSGEPKIQPKREPQQRQNRNNYGKKRQQRGGGQKQSS